MGAGLDFEFSTRKLERLYTEEFGASKYPPQGLMMDWKREEAT